MNSIEKLQKAQTELKPVYLMHSKEEIIAERNRIENNWSDSMRHRMQSLALLSIQKFNTPLSKLS